MAGRDIVAIGASAGGIKALGQLLTTLPADLPAAVFITLHMAPDYPSRLPKILSSSSKLPVRQAEDSLPVARGNVYVAPPDRHLLFFDGVMSLSQGPRENRHRPCINAMFRSAAEQYGPRVTGVLLTGLLDDGAAGLWEIKQRGGVTIAQDPEEAEYPSMPLSAIQGFAVDHVARLKEIGLLLDGLTRQEIDSSQTIRSEVSTMEASNQACPECGGVMQKVRLGSGLEEYRCHVGHRMGAESMLVTKEEVVQSLFWKSLSQLDELIWLMEDRARSGKDSGLSELTRKIGERKRVSAELRELLREAEF